MSVCLLKPSMFNDNSTQITCTYSCTYAGQLGGDILI